MQNRALILSVCLVALAALGLLFVQEQSLIEPALSEGENSRGLPATDSHLQQYGALNATPPLASSGHGPLIPRGNGPNSAAPAVSKKDVYLRLPMPQTTLRLPTTLEAEGAGDRQVPERRMLTENGGELASSAASGWVNNNPTRHTPRNRMPIADRRLDSAVSSSVDYTLSDTSTDSDSLAEPKKRNEWETANGSFSENSNTSIAASAIAIAGGAASQVIQVQNQQPVSGGSTEEESEATQLGVPPPKRTPAFLKKRSILLEPGQYQFEYGVRYSVDTNSYALAGLLQEGTTSVQVVNANQKRQLISSPIEMRIGLMENLQGFLSLPVGWSAQSLTAGGSQSDSDVFGIGDLGIGFTRVMWAPDKSKFRLLGFLQVSAPTGQGEISLSQQDRDATLGAGYWTLTMGGNVTESIDPLILFGSFGYTHTYGTRIDADNYINVGNTLFYQAGVGYGINPNVTLSGSFSGASSGKLELNGNTSTGTRSEPFSLRISASINKPKNNKRSKLGTNYEPFLRYGLTNLSNDVEFGVRWTY